MAEKQRHGCLTAWLVLMIIANSGLTLHYLASGETVRRVNPAMPDWTLPVLIAGGLLNVAFAFALLQWKKWGFIGSASMAVVLFVVNLVSGFGPRSFGGLIGFAILYALLRLGGERNAWYRLE